MLPMLVESKANIDRPGLERDRIIIAESSWVASMTNREKRNPTLVKPAAGTLDPERLGD